MYSGRKYWGAFSHSDFWLEGKGRSESVALQTLEHLLADFCHHRSSYCRRKRHTNCISFMITDCSLFMTVLFTLKRKLGDTVQYWVYLTKDSGFSSWVWKIPWRREWLPLQYSCPANSMERGEWWATKGSMGSQKVGCDWTTDTFTSLHIIFIHIHQTCNDYPDTCMPTWSTELMDFFLNQTYPCRQYSD